MDVKPVILEPPRTEAAGHAPRRSPQRRTRRGLEEEERAEDGPEGSETIDAGDADASDPDRGRHIDRRA